MPSFGELLAKSTLLAIALTAPPVFLLILMRELDLINPMAVLGWGMFALGWTAFVTLRFLKRHERGS